MIKISRDKPSKAVCVLRELSQDEKTKLIFEAQEKARMDYEDRMDGAFGKGKIEGKIEEKIKGIIMLVSKYNVPLNSAMSDFNLEESYKPQIIDELNKNNIKYTE